MTSLTNNDSPLHSILRIKRKRTTGTAPLDALVIEETAPPTKRRRNQSIPISTPDIPVESSSSRGIFRFAETVSLDSFDTDKKTRQVRDRITAFLLHPPPALARINSSSSFQSSSQQSPNTPPLTPSTSSTPLRKLPSSLRAARVSAQESRNGSPSNNNSPLNSMSSSRELPSHKKEKGNLQERVDGFHEESKRARYRIIKRRREEKAGWEMRRGPLPPVVKDSKDLENEGKEPFMRIYDAVEEDAPLSGSNVNILANNSGQQDDMMDNFVPMLKEYLSLQESMNPSTSSKSPPRPTTKAPMNAGEDSDSDDDDEFVYDVYYRDLRPQDDMNDVSGANGLKRIGELAGLQDEEILTNELSSEEEDEADQDSNEENDYRNDYPSSESDRSEEEGRWEEE